jgi:hypothetical protein
MSPICTRRPWFETKAVEGSDDPAERPAKSMRGAGVGGRNGRPLRGVGVASANHEPPSGHFVS